MRDVTDRVQRRLRTAGYALRWGDDKAFAVALVAALKKQVDDAECLEAAGKELLSAGRQRRQTRSKDIAADGLSQGGRDD